MLSYNQISGQSVERIAALSDGIFAVAMTLLVLDLHVPASDAAHDEKGLLHSILAMAPQVIAYLMTFLTLGIFWSGQQVQLNLYARSDRTLTWMQLGFLFGVTLMPFATRLLGEYMHYRSAIACYWLNILMLGTFLYVSWRHAVRAGLVKDDTPPEIGKAIERRIVVAQLFYLVGALVCTWSTVGSIAFIVLVQVNFAFAPKIKWLYKI
jgi:uncharacterized membrane protein